MYTWKNSAQFFTSFTFILVECEITALPKFLYTNFVRYQLFQLGVYALRAFSNGNFLHYQHFIMRARVWAPLKPHVHHGNIVQRG